MLLTIANRELILTEINSCLKYCFNNVSVKQIKDLPTSSAKAPDHLGDHNGLGSIGTWTHSKKNNNRFELKP